MQDASSGRLGEESAKGDDWGKRELHNFWWLGFVDLKGCQNISVVGESFPSRPEFIWSLWDKNTTGVLSGERAVAQPCSLTIQYHLIPHSPEISESIIDALHFMWRRGLVRKRFWIRREIWRSHLIHIWYFYRTTTWRLYENHSE